MNWQLFSILWAISATVLTGIFLTTILLLGYGARTYLIAAVIIGMLLAVPIAFVLTKKMKRIK